MFQQDAGRDVKTSPAPTADLDTGENSRQRDEVDGYEDTDGMYWYSALSLTV